MKPLILAAAFLLLLTSAEAALVGLPSQMTLRNEELQVPFTISNDTDFPQDISFELYVPFEYRVLEGENVVGSHSEAPYRLAFFPTADLIGSRYQGKAIARVGGEVFERDIIMQFEAGDACKVEATATPVYTTDEEALEITVRLDISNLSGSEAAIDNIEMTDIPFSWQVAPPAEAMVVQPYRAEQLKITLMPDVPFNGTGKVQFTCNGVPQTTPVELETGKEVNWDQLTGWITFGGEGDSNELLLDAVLFIVAVVLLFTFITRYLRRYAEQREFIARARRGNK